MDEPWKWHSEAKMTVTETCIPMFLLSANVSAGAGRAVQLGWGARNGSGQLLIGEASLGVN